MHNPNSSILKAFCNHLIDLYDDLIPVYPKNVELRNGKTWIELTRKINPKILIRGWHQFFNDASYYKQIKEGNINFFLEKNYENELIQYNGGKNNNKEYKDFIEEIKKIYIDMEKENQKKLLKYIQNLCKLAGMYYN